MPVKKENEICKTITYKIKFIDSVKFMGNSLSILIDSLVEGLPKVKCKGCNSSHKYVSQWQFVSNQMWTAKKTLKKSLMMI